MANTFPPTPPWLRRDARLVQFFEELRKRIAGDAEILVSQIYFTATDRLLGRDTAGAGAGEEIQVGGNLEFTGSGSIQRGELTGDVTAAAGSGATTIANKTGADTGIVTGTAGGNGNLVEWNGDGDAVDSGVATADLVVSGDNPITDSDFGSAGLMAATDGAGAYASRTLTGTSNEIDVANGDGAAGNPMLSLPTAMTLTGKTLTGGTYTGVDALDTKAGGAASGSVIPIGKLTLDLSAVGNVGAGEDDLMTYSLPASAFDAAGRGVRVTAWGTTENNANAKTLKAYFGSVILTTSLTVSQAGVWRVVFEVFSTGTDTQQYISQLAETGSTLDLEQGTLAEDDGSAITIKMTGEATTDNDIVQEGLLVEFLN